MDSRPPAPRDAAPSASPDLAPPPVNLAPPHADAERSIPVHRIDPDAIKVLKRLERNGHTAFLVGGGVRDLLLDRTPKDFDIGTSARPNEVRSMFRNCRVIGRRFRLAHILFSGGKVIEVATFRREPGGPEELTPGEESDTGESTPRFGPDADLLIRQDNVFGNPEEDARRRDFTMNGLFYDLKHERVIDYVGGVRDIDERVVRTIGDPNIRCREDPVRILRAIKFAARLDFGIHPDLYDAIVETRGDLARSAPPRVLEEILRLLRGGASQRSYFLAWDTGVLAVVMRELAAFLDDDADGAAKIWGRLRAIDEHTARYGAPPDAVLLSALIQGPIEEAIDGARDPMLALVEAFNEVTARLAVPRRLKDRARTVLFVQKRLRTGKIGSLPRRDFFRDAALLHAFDCVARGVEVPSWARIGS